MEKMNFADVGYQAKRLLMMTHAARCSSPPNQCPFGYCPTMKNLYAHIQTCNQSYCSYPDCHNTKILYNHIKTCFSRGCSVCVPSRHYVSNLQKAAVPTSSSSVIYHPQPSMNRNYVTNFQVAAQNPSHLSHCSSAGQVVTRPPFVNPIMDPPQPSSMNPNYLRKHQEAAQKPSTGQVIRSAFVKLNSGQPQQSLKRKRIEQMSPSSSGRSCVNDHCSHSVPVPEINVAQEIQRISPVQQETKKDISSENFSFATGRTKSIRKPKVKAVSLIDTFNPKMIREHIESLQKCTSESIAKSEKACHSSENATSEICQLCKADSLVFQHCPIYCATCSVQIKRSSAFYAVEKGETQGSICTFCYKHMQGDSIEISGKTILKGEMEKKINNEKPGELWVQCDKCEAWQHQICALFNRRTGGGYVKYTCPFCCIAEIERKERRPLLQNVFPGANNLPTSRLSDHIEQRLLKRFTEERQERAKISGKSVDKVPAAEALIVRVVSSVNKTLEVKKTLLDIIQDKRYPTAFPYKSKAVLLFQYIDGVQVCIFGMFVQEFGSDCQPPNQRRVYISYLDSVKYFRPDIKTASGEPLRTFVYHELLIGYLEYCKYRGYTSCYIWSSPPCKGSGDYILYCHPQDQKTPKPDKLREWYVSMLGKAKKENIVISYTNLHDLFFVSKGECKAKVTLARLPYFDGDQLPRDVEQIATQLPQKDDSREHQKRRKTDETTFESDTCLMDSLLMQKLGKTLSEKKSSGKRNKENYIMVHLQHACTHCCDLMVSGNRWVCSECDNFQLCDRCYDDEQKIDNGKRHPVNSRDKHALHRVQIKDVPVDTEDRDEVLESKFFDSRLSFLNLCEGNYYQYDTLRRAKHSSMMLLYHLHNPTAPAFLPKCNICHNEVDIGQGWGCEICSDYVVCIACYGKGGIHHPHGLTVRSSTTAECDDQIQNDEDEEGRVVNVRTMLDLVVHGVKCKLSDCFDPNCKKLKALLRHRCISDASAGCVLCKKKWSLLQLHACHCKELECQVPKCKDLKASLQRRLHRAA